MTTQNAAMTAAGLAAFGSATMAAMVIWLLLARPLDVVDAVSGHDLGGLARLAFSTLRFIVSRSLREIAGGVPAQGAAIGMRSRPRCGPKHRSSQSSNAKDRGDKKNGGRSRSPAAACDLKGRGRPPSGT